MLFILKISLLNNYETPVHHGGMGRLDGGRGHRRQVYPMRQGRVSLAVAGRVCYPPRELARTRWVPAGAEMPFHGALGAAHAQA